MLGGSFIVLARSSHYVQRASRRFHDTDVGVGERCKHLLFTCTINTEMFVVRTAVFCFCTWWLLSACGPIAVTCLWLVEAGERFR
jgi:hypothetical protein